MKDQDGNVIKERVDDSPYKKFMKYYFPWIAVLGLLVFNVFIHPLNSKVHFENGDKEKMENQVESNKYLIHEHANKKDLHVDLQFHTDFQAQKGMLKSLDEKMDQIISMRNADAQYLINIESKLDKNYEELSDKIDEFHKGE